MPSQHQTHDIKIFSGMVEILISSILEEENYGFSKTHHQTHYEELATAMNHLGDTNKHGSKLTANALKQIVYRVRRNKKYENILENLKPDWDKFRDTDYGSSISYKSARPDCLVCGGAITNDNNQNRKICSADCVREYHKHKDVPCDTKFPTIFHQINYENAITAGE